MTFENLLALRRAANAAHDQGNHAQAMSLCRRIAAYYLSTGQWRTRHPIKPRRNARENVG
jgi:hypothetical protein